MISIRNIQLYYCYVKLLSASAGPYTASCTMDT